MTIAGYVAFIFGAIIIMSIALTFGSTAINDNNTSIGVGYIISGVILSIALFFGMRWYFNGTEVGKRALKTQESNFDGGINRCVKVYDAVGNLLKEYQGHFDVDFNGDEQRVLFDDENGKRHVVYFKTGTIVIDEVD